jgi:hypothetical protein
MSFHTVGSDTKYVLPASYDSIPQAFMSNKSAKPIPSSLQTVNIPALTSNQNASGTSIVQLPCGSSAGIMMNPYLRLDVTMVGGTAGTSAFKWKGVSKCATSILNRLSTYINSVQVDNIQNADQVYDQLFSHSTSYDWLAHDAKVLLGADVSEVEPAGGWAVRTYIIPLIGALGTQQGMPLFALNGTLQVQLDYNSIARSICQSAGTAGDITGFQVSNVQLVYDKISVEQAFVDKVKADMNAGHKYVLGYTNFQSTTVASASGTAFFNYGLNVSSLRALVAQQMLTADLTATASTNTGASLANGLSQFQVSLDGRLINSNTLNASANPALVFAELNKCFSRLFDASITDISTYADFISTSAGTGTFAVGVSAQRTNEALAFAGSPVSVVGLNFTTSASTYTMFLTFISDYQILVDSAGGVEIVR